MWIIPLGLCALAVGTIESSDISIGIDYKHNFLESLGVFAGMGVVQSVIKTTELGEYKPLGLGLNAGFSFLLTSFIELELRLRYIIYGNHTKDSHLLPTINGASEHTVHFGNPLNFYLGLNVRL